jgi:ribosomal protein S18 acetylase RimI-like enzyme
VSKDVRIATPDDARAIAEIHVASWQEGYRGQLPDSYLKSLSADTREATWAQSLSDGAAVLLTEHAGKLLGFVSYGPSRDDDAPETGAEIYGLYVHPHAWSTGKGQQLHDGALAALGASGSTVVTLWVLTSNERPTLLLPARLAARWGHEGCRVGRGDALPGALQASTGPLADPF